MKLFYRALVCILFLGLLSCSPAYYVPTTQVVPLFTGKNQGTAHLAFSLYEIDIVGLSFSGAYSITDHFAVSSNALIIGSRNDVSTKKGVSVGLGGIYFFSIDENLVFESTLGFTGGNVINGNFEGLDIQNKVNFISLFVQPSIGYVKKNVELALSVKYNVHSYTNLNSEFLGYYNSGLVNTFDGFPMFDNPIDKPYHFIEPAVTIRFGWKSVKYSIQFASSYLMSSTEIARRSTNINLGWYLTLGK